PSPSTTASATISPKTSSVATARAATAARSTGSRTSTSTYDATPVLGRRRVRDERSAPDRAPRRRVLRRWRRLPVRLRRSRGRRAAPARTREPRRRVVTRVPLGRLFATPGALRALEAAGVSVFAYLGRHARGDWGAVCPDDWRANDRALVDDTRLLSAYVLPTGVKVWIITEADRASTTVLLPDEY